MHARSRRRRLDVSSPEGWKGNGWHGLLRGQQTLHTYVKSISSSMVYLNIFMNDWFDQKWKKIWNWKNCNIHKWNFPFRIPMLEDCTTHYRPNMWCYSDWCVGLCRDDLNKLKYFHLMKVSLSATGPIGDKQTIFHYVSWISLFIVSFSIHKLSYLSVGLTRSTKENFNMW